MEKNRSKYQKKYYIRNKLKYQNYFKGYYLRHRDELIEKQRVYASNHREQHLKVMRAYSKQYDPMYRLLNKEKKKAQHCVRNKPLGIKCVVQGCKRNNLEHHHPDYSQPYVTTTLCERHHKQYHSCMKAGYFNLIPSEIIVKSLLVTKIANLAN
jgi:hypothetical protein